MPLGRPWHGAHDGTTCTRRVSNWRPDQTCRSCPPLTTPSLTHPLRPVVVQAQPSDCAAGSAVGMIFGGPCSPGHGFDAWNVRGPGLALLVRRASSRIAKRSRPGVHAAQPGRRAGQPGPSSQAPLRNPSHSSSHYKLATYLSEPPGPWTPKSAGQGRAPWSPALGSTSRSFLTGGRPRCAIKNGKIYSNNNVAATSYIFAWRPVHADECRS